MTVILDNIESVCHVCEKDSYLQIFEHGLRTADQLLRDYGYSDEDREALVHHPRRASVPLPPTGPYGAARIAHNVPLLDPAWQGKLRESLEQSNCTLEDYCKLLNTRVYFWAHFKFENGQVTGDANGYTYEVADDGVFDVIRVRFSALKRLAAEQEKRIDLTDLNSEAPRTPSPAADRTRGRHSKLIRVTALFRRSASSTASADSAPSRMSSDSGPTAQSSSGSTVARDDRAGRRRRRRPRTASRAPSTRG